MAEKVLIIGSCGQVGTELLENLQGIYGPGAVVASDIRTPEAEVFKQSEFVTLDVLKKGDIQEVFSKHKPTIVFHLAALLSASAEKKPKLGWDLNMNGLFNIFDACLEYKVQRVFWPSSIAVFGPSTPRINTPQQAILEPNTIYGISKLAGERFCEYYYQRYGLDVRSIRYPGLIGWKSEPGGGTTDYAVDIFHQALRSRKYECFLSAHTKLPMLHMEDAVNATLKITFCETREVKIRSSYNIAGVSFNPEELAAEIAKHIPGFEISYNPDQRQKIADGWPESIDDSEARADWAWFPKYDLHHLVTNMLENLGTSSI
jgi:nucleoside-diphosphate-sugar epimerase